MEYLTVLKGIVSLDCKESFTRYLSALEEHQSFQSTGSKNIDEVVQVISSLLVKSTTRVCGLMLLRSFLNQCSYETFEPKATLWTTQVLKAAGNQQDQQLAVEVLTRIVEKSQNLPAFGTNHLQKIYEALTNTSAGGRTTHFRCIETCLRLYPGPSAPSRSIIERYIFRFIDSPNEEIAYAVGKCHLLLQQVRGGTVQGLSQKALWENLQLKLLGSLHDVLDAVFEKCPEIYEVTTVPRPKLDVVTLELSDVPVERAAQLYVRFRNLISYLIAALSEPFPVEKNVKPKRLLDLIVRGLSVTCRVLQRTAISDNIAVALLLPKMHLLLLQLLHTLLLLLGSHLKIYHTTILGLLNEALKITLTTCAAGTAKALLGLRIKVYEVIALWCSVMGGGARFELHGEFMVEQVLADVYPFHAEFSLQVMSGARKHMSKKARRQLHKSQNEKSNLTQTYSTTAAIRKENLSDEANQTLCIAALRCLRAFLLSASRSMKPVTLKVLHIKLLEICGIFYELPLRRQHLYAHWQCRAEIYSLLCTLLEAPLLSCPPPTEIILSIIQVAATRDGNTHVRQMCTDLLCRIETIVHPSKEGLLFPLNFRDIRNEFKNIGPEDIFLNSIASNATLASKTNMVEEADDLSCDLSEDAEAAADVGDNAIELPGDVLPEDISDSVLEEDSHIQSDGDTPSNASPVTILSNETTDLPFDSCESEPEEILAAPQPKKPRIKTTEADHPEIAKIACKNIEAATIEDEDMLLADIEATFVDELN